MQRPLAGVLLACVAGISSGCPDESQGDLRPFNDVWQLELDVPFPYLSASGEPQIQAVLIGGRTDDDNYANRGDVVVSFDPTMSPQTARIRVEMRRHAMARSEDEAQEIFDALSLWASSGRLTPEPSLEDSCTAQWHDGCQLRVYYDGLTQLARSGADLRVTLPWFYRHDVEVRTEDMEAESSYSRRGDVCIEGLNATAEIGLGSGRAFVMLAEETQPMPRCEFVSGGFDDCETDPQGAWAPTCACLAQSDQFGRVKVETWDGSAANATVDVPAALWTTVSMVNQGENQMRGADPPCADTSPPGMRCDACVELADYALDPSIGTEETRQPWVTLGVANRPSAAAVATGYRVEVASKVCEVVRFTESPEQFVGPDDGDMQMAEERGNLRLCAGCLRGVVTCHSLIGP